MRLQPFLEIIPMTKVLRKLRLYRGMVEKEESRLLSGTCVLYADINKEFTDLDSDDKLVSFFSMLVAQIDDMK